MALTEEQIKVRDTRKKNMLVSAAAGSGKTFVLVERIISEILDEKNGIDVCFLQRSWYSTWHIHWWILVICSSGILVGYQFYWRYSYSGDSTYQCHQDFCRIHSWRSNMDYLRHYCKLL